MVHHDLCCCCCCRESLPAHLYHSEAALLVVPTPVRIGDAGVVIAAARLSRKANQQGAKYVVQTSPHPPLDSAG
jgi:hypothetical protein